ncbi:MAG: alanine--tRNA ligase-related protein [Oscillibacter sp.]|jgi:alanyl-tRNA synthetase|nr:alanine--tRNA ligase-related protein [Oscillibacter sp.]
METEKLYYTDPFMKEFTAEVLTCQPGKDGYLIVLDRTAFYPEGGGQPADHGKLEDGSVVDVHEKDGVIVHTCTAPAEVGARVTGVLEWARRFDHMQQHSGEHILSGILCRSYGCDNVGFHLGAETVTIDYNTEITWEQAIRAEQLANTVIAGDRPVEITYPSREALKRMDYRSKKEIPGRIRIVTFPEADCCACCGTHVLRAGQVGLIKVLSVQKFRDGVRIEIVSGDRALQWFSRIYDQNRIVAQALSVKVFETAAAVERTIADLAACKARESQLEDQVFFGIARAHAGQGDVVLLQPPMRPDAVRKLADAVAKTAGGLAAVFAGSNGEKINYALVRSDGGDISQLVKALNASLRGRGGGRSGFAQGSIQATRLEIETFFEELKKR